MRKRIVILACFIVCSMQGYSQSKDSRQLSPEEQNMVNQIKPTSGDKIEISKAVESTRVNSSRTFTPTVPSNITPVPLQRFLKPDGKVFFDALSQREKYYYVDLAETELKKAENKKSTKPIEDELSDIIFKNLGVKLDKKNLGNMLASNDSERVARWAGGNYKKTSGNIPPEVLNQVLDTYERLLPSYKDKKKKDEDSGRIEEVNRLQEINERLHAWCPECGKK